MQSNNNLRKRTQVEEMGVYFEKLGHPPVESRVLSYLLLAEPPFATILEIQDFLQSSRSAVDNALTFLEANGKISTYSSEDKTRYFMVNAELWVEVAQKKITEWNASSALLANIVKKNKLKASCKHRNLNYILKFEKFIQDKWVELFKEWKITQSATTSILD